ncbi:glycine--tRNA ligase subunit beta [Salibacterium halotolerans]|uniref:Glycine--tRNA ligase beta subunit n=1 Tax=Salibacterium halotolerans TaxID=1884432 RepID=A0A1I5NIK3_9BACI|nr:glycine--tRNA ligase subunit beta [Salibacterium halotolerans]SFP21051.1 glycyl-tRNA synthetase beta chain [Salibacterium halotolerans]
MSNQHFLLEIGMEEMPARFVTDAMQQLQQKVGRWLTENRLAYESIDAFSTPRRLAVRVNNLAGMQEDVVEEAKGPARQIALDEEGNWTKAAAGFARGQGAELDDLYFQDVKGSEYVFVRKEEKGKPAAELLKGIDEVITGLTFPKNMRWSTYDLRFVRPIHWLTAVLGSDVIPFTITDVDSGRLSHGHRVLGGPVDIPDAGSYEQALLEQYVMAEPKRRRETIRQQLQDMADKENWNILITEDLLEEVNNLVEYPTALYGRFEERFLELPEEVLITSMREHQRYFPVEDKNGHLIPYFVTVRNGNADYLENVQKGNEKVIRARLSDAVFFYEEDQKLTPDGATAKLDSIVFHENLGTIGDKVRRVQDLASSYGSLFQLNENMAADTQRAAAISKFDLVTLMVDEFTELQGLMGEKYALLAGENPEAAQAVREHYKPKHASDDVPASRPGAVLGLAEKMDTIAACFGIGLIPTGSQDPHGLRRQAAGAARILMEHEVAVPLETFVHQAVHEAGETGLLQQDAGAVEEEILSFFRLRLKTLLDEQGIRHDIADAVLEHPGRQVREVTGKAAFLQSISDDASFKDTVEALSRVTNIARKAEDNLVDVQENLLEGDEEVQLYHAAGKLEEELTDALDKADIQTAYNQLEALKPLIDSYFDHVMVMADDEAVKNNRLAMMKQLSSEISRFADFRQIVFS